MSIFVISSGKLKKRRGVRFLEVFTAMVDGTIGFSVRISAAVVCVSTFLVCSTGLVGSGASGDTANIGKQIRIGMELGLHQSRESAWV